MCAVCRVMGSNVFEDDPEHDVNEGLEVAVALDGDVAWYVWRRSDGFVNASNEHPDEAFVDDEYRYFMIVVSTDLDEVQATIMMALACN